MNALGTAGKAGGTAAPGGIKTVSDCLNPRLGAITLWSRQIQINPPIWELCNSNLFQVLTGPFTGNIGIGLTTPSTRLEVNGAITADQWYDITTAELPFLSIGWPVPNIVPGRNNTWLGLSAGGQGTNTADTGIDNTFLGANSGSRNLTGNYNTFTGEEAGFLKTTGDQNTFSGYRAGYRNFDKSFNTFLGSEAGHYNNGSNNVCVGVGACFGPLNYNGNPGSNNTIAGFNAGRYNTADNNSFYGYQAGFANTTASFNTLVGYQAGNTNTLGQGETFVGFKAGFSSNNPTGDNCCNTLVGYNVGALGPMTAGGNSCFGNRACEALTTGLKNTASGYWSGLVMTTGQFNSFYGDQSGQANVSGNYNTFLGTAAGDIFVSGDSNIFVGTGAGGSENNVSNNIEIGNPGLGVGNGTIAIGIEGTQLTKTYIAGIFTNPTLLADQKPVFVDSTGHLGIGAGGGGVSGNCNALGQNYITKWFNGTTVECSHIYEESTSGQNHVGIDGIPGNAQLDVVGGLGNVNTTNTRRSYMIGYNPVLQVVGFDNLAVGVGACPNSIGGTNACVGGGAGSANTTGYFNTFVGGVAGAGNTIGIDNTFVGEAAGQNNVTGNDNVYVGEQVGFNATGSGNVYIGNDAGRDNTGSLNIFVGFNTGNAASGSSHTIRIGEPPNISNTYIQGIYGVAINPAKLVCIGPDGHLGTTCTLAPQAQGSPQQEQVIAQQQQQIESLQKQNAEFQQRLSRLEALIAQK